MSTCLDYTAKRHLFRSFIKCYIDYCPVVWHFCNISDIRKIEKVQYRALKFVCNDFKSSYTELRTKMLEKLLMYIQLQRAILLEVCKLHLILAQGMYRLCFNILHILWYAYKWKVLQPKCYTTNLWLNNVQVWRGKSMEWSMWHFKRL